MANTIELAKIFQKELDKQLLMGAATGFMEANAGQVIYNGGDTVKIPSLSMDGMGDYNRSTGYVEGGVTLTYKEYTMTQDRGRQFYLDAMDVNESNFVANAANVMGEFQRTKVIPEIDSYRMSKIAALAIGAAKSTTYTPVKADILDKLDADIEAVADIVGDTESLIIMMSIPTSTVLNSAIDKKLDVTNFVAGEINTKVKMYNGHPIILVPSARMKTVYKVNDGKTTGQEAGGLVADSTAKNINWVVLPQRVPIAVSKTDIMRIFDPTQVQKMNAYQIDYRKYHDLWIPANRLAAVHVNVGE